MLSRTIQPGDWVVRLLMVVGGALLLVGAGLGWGYPALSLVLGWPTPQVLSATHIDASTFQGAELTALSVLIAVVLGFNVTLLQIASQAHSLRVSRDVLRDLLPFLGSWTIVTLVTLVDFLSPPVYVLQIWQDVCWFMAVMALMIAYLWSFPRQLTGEFIAGRALHELQRVPLTNWEDQNGHAVLQSMMAGAIQRGDLATTRSLMELVGEFLATWRDPTAEAHPGYDRRRYRALRNLFIAAAQQAETAPNAVSYSLGAAEAGYLLQSIAGGHAGNDREHPLFSSLLRDYEAIPGRLVALVTGIRHSLMRESDGPPLLIRYWTARSDWPLDDPRLTTGVVLALVSIFAEVEERLGNSDANEVARTKVGKLIPDLVQSCDSYLLPAAEAAGDRAVQLALKLKDQMERQVAELRAAPARLSGAASVPRTH